MIGSGAEKRSEQALSTRVSSGLTSGFQRHEHRVNFGQNTRIGDGEDPASLGGVVFRHRAKIPRHLWNAISFSPDVESVFVTLGVLIRQIVRIKDE